MVNEIEDTAGPDDGGLALLRSMAEASPLAISVSEGETHVLRYVNPAFCRLYGRPAADLLGQPFAVACPDPATAVASTLLDQVFESGAAGSVADLSRVGPEKDAAYWSYAAWPLIDRDGSDTQAAGAAERQLAARDRQGELQQTNQQLLLAVLREDERSEKLQLADRAKDEFVAMLAHELRSPLASIRAGIYLLGQRAAPADTDTQETCALLERQMRHLSRLLDDLLDVSRITRGKIPLHLEPVDVAESLRNSVAASRALLESNRHQLSLTLPAEPMWVDADPVRLEQVVTNLLQNAIKYMEPGGQVWLSLERESPESGSGTPAGAGTAVIRVRDLGIGISPEALLHIFDLFMQADPRHGRGSGGLGIGLMLVKSLVGLHGGSVEARSAGLGRGSEFKVLLPLRDAPVSGAGSTSGTGRSADAAARAVSGARILIIEDNIAAATTLSEVLELWGYAPRIAHSGIMGLAAAEAERPDMVLLDIGLPGMDGYEVARRLRADPKLRDTLLIALTGYGQETDRERSREAGIAHHLTKPVDLEQLRWIIGTHCAATPPPPEPEEGH